MMGFFSAFDGDSNLLDGNRLRTEGTWGAFHELGHNLQWNKYTTDATVQTGCNWWSIVMNEVRYRLNKLDKSSTSPVRFQINKISINHCVVKGVWSIFGLFVMMKLVYRLGLSATDNF